MSVGYLQVEATDSDSGNFGSIVYSMANIDDMEDGFFNLDRSTGALIVARMLDREEKSFHELIIIAR